MPTSLPLRPRPCARPAASARCDNNVRRAGVPSISYAFINLMPSAVHVHVARYPSLACCSLYIISCQCLSTSAQQRPGRTAGLLLCMLALCSCACYCEPLSTPTSMGAEIAWAELPQTCKSTAISSCVSSNAGFTGTKTGRAGKVNIHHTSPTSRLAD